MSDNQVSIEINGQTFTARKGAMIIEVADAAGIRIPRFCYHKKLSVAANCRMCLVEVEKAPKPLPACATPVADGMKIFTQSPKALAAQKGTMEFLLINHPLDCPICDQGGECELQDVAMGYGGDVSRYNEGKRVVQDYYIGPLIATDMTRCIHCTRCVRFGEELAGIRELGATGRGEHTRIGTYIKSAVQSEMSGNVIDLCPVGALTARPSRFSARAWELNQYPGIALHDCAGSNTYLHTFRGKVNRTVPRDLESINECWLSDRDRFAYEGFNAGDRLTVPMIRRNGNWQETDWDTALQEAVKGLQAAMQGSGDALGVLVSPNATLEEMLLLQQLATGLGCANLDHRLRQTDFSDQEAAPKFPWLGVNIETLEALDAALLIGSNVRKEQPILAHRLRKAAMRGAALLAVNPRDFGFHFPLQESVIADPYAMAACLAGVAKALADITGKTIPSDLQHALMNVEMQDVHTAMAERLNAAEHGLVLLGTQALTMPNLAVLRRLAAWIAEASGTPLGYLTDGANSSGAWLAGILPHRGPAGVASSTSGLHALAMWQQPRSAYLLHNIEPERDCADPALALRALQSAQCVVSLTAYVSDTMKKYAHVLLPVATYAESSGTSINIQGTWQGFQATVRAPGESRPAWKVLRVLGNLFNLGGFEYDSSEDVLQAHRQALQAVEGNNTSVAGVEIRLSERGAGLYRLSAVTPCHEDAITRRAASLQQTGDARDVACRLNRATAGELGLLEADRVIVRQDESAAGLALVLDDGIPDGCAWIPAASEESARLGNLFGTLHLEAD